MNIAVAGTGYVGLSNAVLYHQRVVFSHLATGEKSSVCNARKFVTHT